MFDVLHITVQDNLIVCSTGAWFVFIGRIKSYFPSAVLSAFIFCEGRDLNVAAYFGTGDRIPSLHIQHERKHDGKFVLFVFVSPTNIVMAVCFF